MTKPAAIKILAPAKVNLYLKVTGKRPDGYHELVSVMQALELADEITVSRASNGVEVTCDNEAVPPGTGNIAYRAASELLDAASSREGVKIHIIKKTPVAAGLGGGSSDAAAVMRAVRLLYGLEVSDDELKNIGLGLGADVPFFLGTPSAVARGVGERLLPLVSPAESWLVLVNPGVSVSTGWVYDNLNLGLTNPTKNIRLPEFLGQSLCDGPMLDLLHNDLERVTVGRYPVVKAVKERLAVEGAAGVLMSGSGSTVFGVFSSRDKAQSAAGRITVPGWIVLATRTISSWPEPEPLY
jgi:4-diphosphocytidyl-2-C-methyl-D-erythritol kinase